MLLNFCTLFDSNYAAKGIAMYESLVKHCPSFHLYIFAFDEKLVNVLNKIKLKYVTVITLKEFEDAELLSIKHTRSNKEYCWTCSGSTILYCLEHFNLESCTYIDADLFFFSDPTILIEEMGAEDDVMITEHRYTSQYDHTSVSGKYCVQFMTFKNTANGMKVLKWWRSECLKWCYARFEDGKFGDQKYLDDWQTRFEGIHVMKHLGGGVAPWNMQQYEFRRDGDSIWGNELMTGKDFLVVFFHFHYFSCYRKWIIREFMITDTGYSLPSSAKDCLYNPYISVIKHCYHKMKKLDKSINGLAMKPLEDDWFILFKRAIKSLFVPECYFIRWLEW